MFRITHNPKNVDPNFGSHVPPLNADVTEYDVTITNKASKRVFRNPLYQRFDLRYYMPYFGVKTFLTLRRDLRVTPN